MRRCYSKASATTTLATLGRRNAEERPRAAPRLQVGAWFVVWAAGRSTPGWIFPDFSLSSTLTQHVTPTRSV